MTFTSHRFRKIDHGVANDVYVIGDNKKNILKIYSRYSFKKVNQIVAFSEMLRLKKIKVPEVIQVFEVCNKPALLLEYVNGVHKKTLNSMRIRAVATLMSRFHRLETKLNIPIEVINKAYFKKLFKLCPGWERIGKIETIFNSINFNYLEKLPRGLIHGDFSLSNILFQKDDNIAGLLDLDLYSYSYLLTDIARCQIFFAFDNNNQLINNNIDNFLIYYNKKRVLKDIEKKHFFEHMKIVLIKMILETYYYVAVKKDVKIKNTVFNQTHEMLYSKLQSIKDKKSIDCL